MVGSWYSISLVEETLEHYQMMLMLERGHTICIATFPHIPQSSLDLWCSSELSAICLWEFWMQHPYQNLLCMSSQCLVAWYLPHSHILEEQEWSNWVSWVSIVEESKVEVSGIDYFTIFCSLNYSIQWYHLKALVLLCKMVIFISIRGF